MSWVVTAYMLAETASTVLAGKFGDLFGRKRVFQLGVAVFIIGSFFCGLANSMGGVEARAAKRRATPVSEVPQCSHFPRGGSRLPAADRNDVTPLRL